MKNTFKPWLALVLALSMVFSLMSTCAWADNSNPWSGQIGISTPTDVVAQIGTAFYTDLQAAFNASSDGDIITLVNDVVPKNQNPITLKVSKNLTLDLGKHKFDYDKVNISPDNSGSVNPPTLTIKNGAIDGEWVVKDGLNITIEDGTVGEYLSAVHGGSFTITGGSFSGNLDAASGGSFTIKGGMFGGSLEDSNGGSFTITGGYFSSEPDENYLAANHEIFLNCDNMDPGNPGTGVDNSVNESGYKWLVAESTQVRFNRYEYYSGEYDTQRAPAGHFVKLNGVDTLRETNGNPNNENAPFLLKDVENPGCILDKSFLWTDKGEEHPNLYKDEAIVMVPANGLDLYADWKASDITLTFFSEKDATEPYAAVAMKAGKVMADEDMPKKPKKDGYEFVGWVKENKDKVYNFDAPDAVFIEDTTFYAMWKAAETQGAPVVTEIGVAEGAKGIGNGADQITKEVAEQVAANTASSVADSVEDAAKNSNAAKDIIEKDESLKKQAEKAAAEGKKLVVVPEVSVQIKGYSEDASGNKSLTLDISAFYNVYKVDENVESGNARENNNNPVNGEPIPIDSGKKSMSISVKLPESMGNFKKLFVRHTHGFSVFWYLAQVADGFAKFDNPNGFSEFVLTTSPEGAVAMIGEQPYATLQQAVDAAADTDLIVIATKTDLGKVKVEATKKGTFKIKNNSSSNPTLTKANLEAMITSGTYNVTITEDGDVFTVKVESGSSSGGGIIIPSTPTPSAPAAPIIKEITDKTIVVNARTGEEYSVDGGKTWKSAATGESTVTFDGLTPETEYSVIARVAQKGNVPASAASAAAKVTTKKTESTEPTEPTKPTPTTPTDVPTNPAYDALTESEKKQADEVAKALGVDKDTAAQMLKVADELGVSLDTVMLSGDALAALKDDSDPKGTDFGKLRARATKRTNTAQTIQWTKQKNADGYLIYGNQCGKKYKLKLLKTIKKNKTVKWTQKKLKKAKTYKYLVVAYKNVNGQKMPIAASVMIHTVDKGGKATVAKSLKLNKTKVSLKKGKSFTVKATEVKEEKKLKIKAHRKVTFESSNPTVAKVSKKGKITAVKKGKATVYAYAQNGVYKTVKVTVK